MAVLHMQSHICKTLYCWWRQRGAVIVKDHLHVWTIQFDVV